MGMAKKSKFPRAKRATVSKEVSEYMASISGRGKGGDARAKVLSALRRKEISKLAARARWNKKPNLPRS